MTSYEIVLKNITFGSPERIAFKYPTLGKGDIVRLFLQRPRACRKPGEQPDMTKKAVPIPGETDEWGILWENADSKSGLGLGQPVGFPIRDWEESYENYVMPDPYEPGRFDGLEQALEAAERECRWVQLNSQYCIFERLHFLRGFENTLVDMYTNEAELTELCDRLLDYQLGIVRQAAELGKGRIHSIDTSDDWGTQNALMINPDMWRKLFKPRYKILVDEMHEHGIYMNFHSCGYITDIMDDLIEIGVDIVNIHQPNLLHLREFGERFAGRICFDVSVDIQETLPTGDKRKIEQEVRDLIRYWGTKEGGFIAAEYRFLDAIGATRESFEYAFQCFERYKDWNRKNAVKEKKGL